MALRIEDDVDVAMDASQLARILTRAIDPSRLRPLTLSERVALEVLRDAVATARPAPRGRRSTGRMAPDERGQVSASPVAVALLYQQLRTELRGALARPGALLEVQVSLVVQHDDGDGGEECDER